MVKNKIQKNMENVKQTSDLDKIAGLTQKIKKLRTKGINVIDLTFDAPQLDAPELILNAANEALKHNKNIQPYYTGIQELKSEICDYIDRTRNFRPKMSQIAVGPGSRSLTFAILISLLSPKDAILTIDPSAPIYRKVSDFIGAKFNILPCLSEGKFMMDLSQLDKIFTENTHVFAFSNPQNPSGSIYTSRELQELSEFIRGKGTLIISDETFSQIVYKGTHYSPGIYDHAAGQTIIIEDLSYQFSIPDWNLGFCIGPKRFIRKLNIILTELFPPVPVFVQYAVKKALENAEELIPELLEKYRKCCELMLNGLNEIENISCTEPSGGIYAFPNVSGTNLTGQQLADELLDEYGIAVLPGETFGEIAKNFLRVSFATSEVQINECIIRLQERF